MPHGRNSSRCLLAGKIGLASLLVAWFLCSSFLAANHALHRALHDEADQGSHQCAITLIEQQQILASDPLPKIVKSSFAFDSKLPVTVSLFVSADDVRLSPGRAPPV